MHKRLALIAWAKIIYEINLYIPIYEIIYDKIIYEIIYVTNEIQYSFTQSSN